MRRLAARGERLTVGALPWVAPVYRAMPQVAEVIEFPLPNPPKGERPPMVAFYAALSGPDTTTPQEDTRPALHVNAAQVQAVLAHFTLTLGGYRVLVPGAEYGPAKRWPVARFAALVQQLGERGETVLLLGSAKEDALAEAILQHAGDLGPGVCRNLAGRTTLDEALALIAGAADMVSNDTGLMHVAAALDVPQVALFGSSSPRHTPPLSPQAQVIWLKEDAAYQPALDCAPCFERACPLGHLRCLNDITPERVLRTLDAL